MGPIYGRNHSQVYPHMRAKFGHDRSSSLAAYTWQTDTQNLYYIDIDRYMLLWKWIQLNQINIQILGLILANYELSKSVSETVLEVYN